MRSRHPHVCSINCGVGTLVIAGVPHSPGPHCPFSTTGKQGPSSSTATRAFKRRPRAIGSSTTTRSFFRVLISDRPTPPPLPPPPPPPAPPPPRPPPSPLPAPTHSLP